MKKVTYYLTKRRIDIFVHLLLLSLLMYTPNASANNSNLAELDVKMKLGIQLKELLQLNAELASKTKAKPAKEGILSIKGPVNFHFLYDDQQLNFAKVRLVIYPIRDYKIDYIHIYPQMDYILKEEMYSKIKSIINQLESKGWKLYNQVASDDYDNILITSGQKDYAYFRYRPDKPEQGFKEL